MTDKKELLSKWEVYSKEEMLGIIESLKEVIRKKDIEKIKSIFRDQKVLRSLIVGRGDKNYYLDLLEESFFILLKNKKLNLIEDDLIELLAWFKEEGLSENIIAFMSDMYFHKRDKEKFEEIFNLVIENKNKFETTLVYYWVLHNKASWLSAVDGDFEKSIECNLEVLAGTKTSEEVLYFKAKVGLSLYKLLMPKQKIRDLKQIADRFLNLGNAYDSFRARAEIAQFILDLSLQQGLKEIAFKSLEEAKQIALSSLKFSKEISYSNLEIVSSRVLAKIYNERFKKITLLAERLKEKDDQVLRATYNKYYKICKDDKRKSMSYSKNAEKLKAKYKYKTDISERYRDTFMKHSGKDKTNT